MEEEIAGESIDELVQVVVLDRESCRLGLLNEDIATTLIAVASEDPADWSEMLAYWPRYTSRAAPEFLSGVALEIITKDSLLKFIGNSQYWIIIDLEQKRFLSGAAFQPIGRDACFAMHTDENGDQHDPLSVHLPPWWELQEQVELEAIKRPRQSAIEMPRIDRAFLFGDAMVQAIADHALEMNSNGRLTEAIKNNEPQTHDPFYPLTIEVHRDWLMTPRADLGGLYPRQMLHGGIDWIDNLIWGQRLRFEGRSGGQIVAAPKDCFGYKHGPMGREEIAIYFDLCRELINASWYWCHNSGNKLNVRAEDSAGSLESSETHHSETSGVAVYNNGTQYETLISFLQEVKLNWLTSPFEGGSAPAFILECSRRRVPRGAGVEIIGMDQRQGEQHIIDCDCPICIMMAEGKMGVGFCSIDGHHLDIDDEFAFSIHETREAWEAQQREFAEFSAKCDRDREERQRKIDAGEIEEDEFASAWSSGVSNTSIPSDTGRELQLTFLLAEIVSAIEQGNSPEEVTACDSASCDAKSSVGVKELNTDFARFRNSNHDELAANAKPLIASLEQIAEAHPKLTSRIADFQSRIVESVRHSPSEIDPMDQRWSDEDSPF